MSRSPSNIRVAVVGAGNWGRNLVRVFQELGALAAVCDTDPDRLAALKLGSAVRLCRSLDELLEVSELAAVVIATPAATHYELARSALAAGKDVFVEKPLALEKSQGDELVELADSLGRILMVGHILRFHPAVLRLQEMVDRGELGRIEYIYSNRLNLGRLRTEENILWSFAPHDVSVILSLVNKQPVAVSAHGAAFLQRAIPDVTVTSIEFPNETMAHAFVSWLHPFKEQRLVVVGSEKMAVFEDSRPDEKLVCYPHRVEWHKGKVPVAVKGARQVIPIPDDEPLRLECEHFLQSVATRQAPLTDGREGLRVLEVLNAAEESLRRNGQVIRLAPKTGRLPLFSFRTLLGSRSGERNREPVEQPLVHPTAVVDEGAELGPGTKVWHFSHISKNCRIGRNCTIGQNVFIADGVIVGDNCKIQNNVSLYRGVVLEDGVFCGPSCVFTNVIDPRAFIEKKTEFRKTLVQQGATIGANATVVCGITLGRFSLIGAGAVVTRDVPDFALMVGVPARQRGWVCQCGRRLKVEGESIRCLCGASYRLRADRLTLATRPSSLAPALLPGLIPEG